MVPPPALAGLVIEIEIIQGRDLVAKDRNVIGIRSSSDPYIKVFGGKTPLGRTKTIMKTLNPVWNEKFELILGADDASYILKMEGQVQMEFRLFDEDKRTEDDPMGTVMVPLKPFEPPNATWYPVTQGAGAFFCKRASGELQIKMTVTARQMNKVERGNVCQLKYDRIKIGLSWDVENGQDIDLDSSCVAVDNEGNVSLDETVYYGNLMNSNLSLVHSGDATSGIGEGDDEMITCELDRIPPNIMALYFILTVATANKTFADVKSAQVRFLSNDTKLGICRYVASDIGPNTTALFLLRLSRKGPVQWTMTPIEEGESMARDFGSLIPEIKSYTRDLIPGLEIDPRERIAVLRKGGVIRVTDYAAEGVLPKWLSFGLAWDVTNGVNIDLDASAIMLDHKYRPLDLVFFKNLVSKDGAVRHSGDEREGGEGGDDETINISLPNVHPKVHYIGFVITSYSGQELDDISKARCHLFDPKTRVEIAQYSMSKNAALDKKTALVMGCLYRNGSDWNLRIISVPAEGRTVHDNVDELQNYLKNNPAQSPGQRPETENIKNEMPAAVPHNEDEVVVIPSTELKAYVA
jgi:tellurium resistance protein TerZ